MKKLLSFILILIISFSGGFAAAEAAVYQTRNVFSDDDHMMFIASANDTLYALRDSGLYRISADAAEALIAPAAALDNRMYTILSDGKAVYGLVSDETLILYLLIDKNGEFVNHQLFETDAFMDLYLQNPVVKNDTLFFMNTNGNKTFITSYSFSSGKVHTISLVGILCFDVMDDGRIIALQRETHWPDIVTSLITIAQDTGEATVWADIDTTDTINRIAYDSEAETVYLFARNEIFTCCEEGSLTLADTFITGDVITAALLPSGAALLVDDSLIIRNFDEDARRLTILDPYGRGEEYRDFLEANPSVDLVFMDSGDQTSEEKFAQDMATQNTDIDIYILSDTNLLGTIKQKGFYVDMAQSSATQTLVSQMYTPFRNAFMKGAQIATFPYKTFFEMLCYHKDTFQALGLTPPKTYEAYFDFCLTWLDSYADSFPDIVLNPFACNISLETLLSWYANEQIRSDGAVQYDTETMKRVIEKYHAVQKAMEDHSDQSQGGTPLFYSYDVPSLGSEDDYMYLPLAFETGAAVAISPQNDDFRYFIINPYSDNIQDALALITSYDSRRTELETALLYENVGSAIENRFYQSESAHLQNALELLEASYAQANPDRHEYLDDQIASQKKLIATYEAESRWAVSQSAITLYKEHVDWLYIGTFNPFEFLLDSLGSGDLKFLKDNESADTEALLTELDRRIKMITLEEGMQ